MKREIKKKKQKVGSFATKISTFIDTSNHIECQQIDSKQ